MSFPQIIAITTSVVGSGVSPSFSVSVYPSTLRSYNLGLSGHTSVPNLKNISGGNSRYSFPSLRGERSYSSITTGSDSIFFGSDSVVSKKTGRRVTLSWSAASPVVRTSIYGARRRIFGEEGSNTNVFYRGTTRNLNGMIGSSNTMFLKGLSGGLNRKLLSGEKGSRTRVSYRGTTMGLKGITGGSKSLSGGLNKNFLPGESGSKINISYRKVDRNLRNSLGSYSGMILRGNFGSRQ